MASPGDQIIAQLIGGVGTFFNSLITAFFGEFITPLFSALAAWFGL